MSERAVVQTYPLERRAADLVFVGAGCSCVVIHGRRTASVIAIGAWSRIVGAAAARRRTDRCCTLYDDGLHADGLPADGTYANSFIGTSQPGDYRVNYRATGTGPGGAAFQRVLFESFGVSTNVGHISGNLTDAVVDHDEDGFEDYVQISFWVTVDVTGDYSVSGKLVDEVEGVTLAASETLADLPAGTSTVSLFFDRRGIELAGIYGPFELRDLQLFEQGPDRLAWVDKYREPYVVQQTITVPCEVGLDSTCDDGAACTCDRCVAGLCKYTAIPWGNADCAGPTNQVNLDDILCVLAGFSSFANCPFGDVHPCDGNNNINLDDILGVLAAFGGATNCPNPCGP